MCYLLGESGFGRELEIVEICKGLLIFVFIGNVKVLVERENLER